VHVTRLFEFGAGSLKIFLSLNSRATSPKTKEDSKGGLLLAETPGAADDQGPLINPCNMHKRQKSDK
jgi:hypothetical protein